MGMQEFDLMVIGGGPAGYVACERAGALGMRVVLFESRALGGVCLNEGCIPSKVLLNSAKIYNYALHGESYGVTVSSAQLDHQAVIARKNSVREKLVAGVSAKMKRNKVTVISGRASVAGRDDNGFIVEALGEQYSAARLLIAAGSQPIIPPIPGLAEGLESGFVLTSREILDIQQLPAKLVIVGGGVIGLEMASYFNTAGCEVTVVEMLDHIGGALDSELSKRMLKAYQGQGITFMLGSKVTELTADSVICESKQGQQTVVADKVLMCIGRRACAEDLGLETLGVLIERGAVVTDEHMRTNVSGLYAAGDINGKSMLAHTAYREAEVAINHMTGKKDSMRYDAVPAVIYTNPEAACVGETLESAKEKGFNARSVKLPISYSGRYLAENEGGDGFCKLIVDSTHSCLLGVHIMGSYASEMIYGAAMMIETQMRIEDIKELVFPHPTVGEIIRETLFEI